MDTCWVCWSTIDSVIPELDPLHWPAHNIRLWALSLTIILLSSCRDIKWFKIRAARRCPERMDEHGPWLVVRKKAGLRSYATVQIDVAVWEQDRWYWCSSFVCCCIFLMRVTHGYPKSLPMANIRGPLRVNVLMRTGREKLELHRCVWQTKQSRKVHRSNHKWFEHLSPL